MRAREPDHSGYAEAEGVKIFYEEFGRGDVTVLLLPAWQIFRSRMWKAQVAFLARHYRVVSYDQPGSGRSDRPTEASAYGLGSRRAYATAVLDATGTDKAVVVGLSAGVVEAVVLAALSPDRVEAVIVAGVTIPLCEPMPEWRTRWNEEVAGDEGWEKANRRFMLEHYDDFAKFYVDEIYPEPHSTKYIEDGRGWAAETEAEILIAANDGLGAGLQHRRGGRAHRRAPASRPVPGPGHQRHRGLLPSRVGRGARREDRRRAPDLRGLGTRCAVPRPGQGEPGRSATSSIGCARRRRAARCGPGHSQRPKRALFVSSPIGLGHAQRDVAIARELRRLAPRPADRLAGPGSRHPDARGQRRDRSTRRRAFWSANPPTSRANRASTTSSASRRSGAWTRSWWPTSTCSTTSSPTISTTCGSATSRGTWTSSSTRTPNASGPRSAG